jgi:cytochrome c
MFARGGNFSFVGPVWLGIASNHKLMKHSTLITIALTLTSGLNAGARAAGDAANGEKLYQTRCMACHSMDDNEMGPRHRGVFNRKAGSVADYAYSRPVKASGVVWNEDNLNKWLSGPEKLIPGQQMNFMVPNEKDRLDLIAYLKKESSDK